MYVFFSILSIISALSAVGLMIYTYFKETKDDVLFDYKKSIFARDVEILLFTLTLLFESLAGMVR